MQIIENQKAKEKLYVEKLENGLTIMIIPKQDTNKKYVIWGTHYGSLDSKFVIPGQSEITEVPDGIAHFLEHKMFEQKDGTNSLDTLTALGVSANAYTTTDHTAYLFETVDHFYEALDELMDYVQNPYFTDENVEKEKGIIAQEIRMGDDQPNLKVYMNAMQCMYEKNPITIDIAGTVETINQIDKDVLYQCYNTFYHPSNMAMVVCGDFRPTEILEEIKKRLVPKTAQGEIKRIYPEEKIEINDARKEAIMEVNMPLFIIGIKDKIISGKEEMIKRHIAIEILLNMLIGKSSELYKRLYEDSLLMSELELEYEFHDTFAHVLIGGQSKDPDQLLKELKNEIEKKKEEGFAKEQFNRVKKMIYGSYIKEYNDVASVARMFLSDYFSGINSFDYLEEYNQVTMEYVEQILKEVFQEENMILSIVKGN